MAAPAVRTLSRYLLRQHVAPLGFALAALTALMLVNTMAKQLSALLGKGLPTGVIVEVFVLSIPFIVAVTLNGIESTNTSTIDRKSTRLNSSHVAISYAVFCLKKKKKNTNTLNY